MSLRVRLLFNFPTYKVLAISIVSLIVGVASIALSVIGLVNKIWGYYVATGIWSGSLIVVTGFFGIASAQTKGVCVVKTFMTFSLFSCVVSLGVIALSVGGLIHDSKFYYEVLYHHPNTKMIHGMLLGTGTLQLILSVLSSVISVKQTCCRPKPKLPVSSACVENTTDFRRGDVRGSQSSSAPLMSSRQKRQNDSSSSTHRSSHGAHQSMSDAQYSVAQQSGSGVNRSGDRNRQEKRRHPRRPSDRSSSDRSRRHSPERDRLQRSSHDNRSPDRYANKPITQLESEAAASGENIIDTSRNFAPINDTFEPIPLDNDLDGLPPYEEVMKDDELSEPLLPLSMTNDLIDVGSISLSAQDSVSNRISLSEDNDCTRTKEIAAEQEALQCLSAALETKVTSANSGISNLLSDPLVFSSNLSSLSGSSNLEPENVREISTDLVIRSQANSDTDDKCAPHLSASERHDLLQKYKTPKTDPQGVMYKGFSRNSDVIKESINDGKPRRAKSFQHSREREFARGKSLSSRHLSIDTDQSTVQTLPKGNKLETSSEKFRPASKSFSRASSIPSKPPPKPPRTSSLRQTNGVNKERPKSATLPYSQIAIIKILDEGKNEDSVTKANDKDNGAGVSKSAITEKTIEKKSDNNAVYKIQPPKFRYPRPKLTSSTFQGISSSSSGQPSNTTKYKDVVQSLNSDKTLPSQPLMQPSVSMAGTSLPLCEETHIRQNSSPVKNDRGLTLSLNKVEASNINETLQSPLKSPTDYSKIPLKDLLMKGQSSNKGVHRLSGISCDSNSSDDDSSENSPSAKSAEAGASLNDDDRDEHNQSDTEGKPMYSFLL